MLTLRCDGRARTAAGDSSTSHDRGLRRATLAVLGWLWTLGCASSSAPPAPPAVPAEAVAKPSVVAVPPLSPDALTTLREQAPEIALDLERLHVLARKHAADGRSEDALELAATTEHLLQIAVASLPAREPDAALANEMATESSEGDPAAPRTRKKPRTAKPMDAPELPMIGAPPVPTDETAEVRRRLSRLANDVGDLRGSLLPDQRVMLEGIQSTLIEADRALSEGLIRRADELADEAERILQSLKGEGAARASETISAEAEQGFLTDVRKNLGDRAIVRGGAVAVRLDGLVQYQGSAWTMPEASPLDGVRPLVRGYREVSLALVTVGAPSQDAFASQKRALQEHLSVRFQIATERVTWMKSTNLRLEPGTYLILNQGAAAS